MANVNVTLNGRPFRATARNVQVELEKSLSAEISRVVDSSLRRTIQQAADQTMNRVFRFIQSQMVGGENFQFSQFTSQIPQPGWAPYSRSYRYAKRSKTGHLRWFLLTGKLASEMGSYSPDQVLREIGSTRIRLSKDRSGMVKTITASVAPNVRITSRRMEAQFGFISRLSRYKLANPASPGGKAYRSLIGPAFLYFARFRIPLAIRSALRGV